MCKKYVYSNNGRSFLNEDIFNIILYIIFNILDIILQRSEYIIFVVRVKYESKVQNQQLA